MSAHLIYVAHNSITNKQYVGQTSTTIERRWRTHRNNASRGLPWKFYKAIRKHGPESFEVFQVGEIAEAGLADELEKIWIILLDSFRSGYNMTVGGDAPMRNRKHSAEERSRMSERRRGNKYAVGHHHSEETKTHLSSILLGRPNAKNRGQQSRLGKHLSIEAKDRIGSATAKWWAKFTPKERSSISRSRYARRAA